MTQPNKKGKTGRQRTRNRTVLALGEGCAEEAFLKHLKELYDRRPGEKITVDALTGGSPDVMINKALRRSPAPSDFDVSFLLLDADMDCSQEARKKAEASGLRLIESHPCLEGMLLAVLEHPKRFDNESSRKCKRRFESKYLDAKRKQNHREYTACLPKELLDTCRRDLEPLDMLLRHMLECAEGG